MNKREVNPIIRLETDRLILRNYRAEDVADVHEYFSRRAWGEDHGIDPMTVEETKAIIDAWIEKDSMLAVEVKGTGKVVGSVGYSVNEGDEYSISTDFNPAYWRQSYTTEAVKELLRYMSDILGAKKLFGEFDIHGEQLWVFNTHGLYEFEANIRRILQGRRERQSHTDKHLYL